MSVCVRAIRAGRLLESDRAGEGEDPKPGPSSSSPTHGPRRPARGLRRAVRPLLHFASSSLAPSWTCLLN